MRTTAHATFSYTWICPAAKGYLPGIQKHAAQRLSQLGPARLLGHPVRDALPCQPFGGTLQVGRLAAAVQALEGNEVGRHRKQNYHEEERTRPSSLRIESVFQAGLDDRADLLGTPEEPAPHPSHPVVGQVQEPSRDESSCAADGPPQSTQMLQEVKHGR